MLRRVRRVLVVFVVVLAIAAATGLAIPQAHATGFTLGDAANYGLLYEGNGGQTLSFNNADLVGNIGIGNTGKFQGNGPGTITGNIASRLRTRGVQQ
jgi:hypothetical protein